MPSPMLAASSRYKAHLDGLAADGVLDLADVSRVIEDARSGGFNLSRAYFLDGWSVEQASRLVPEARQALEAFLRDEAPHLATMDPEVGALPPVQGEPQVTDAWADREVLWGSAPRPLVHKGFAPDDPVQQEVADCYFIASLSAIAATRPELLAEALTQHPDGTLSVRFFERADWAGPSREIEVDITSALPTWKGNLIYAADAHSDELWPMYFEKAFAKWKGGYEQLNGGMASNALFALTGKEPRFELISPDGDAEKLFSTLRHLCDEGRPTVAATRAFVPTLPGLIAGHAYAVLGVSEVAGARRVILRNPYGSDEPQGDGVEDGTFQLSLEAFAQAYSMIEYV